MEQLQIRIYPDGRIEAQTSGIKGKKCQEYVKIFEELLEARTVDSSYTDEYYQTEVHNTADQDVEQHSKERQNIVRNTEF